VHSNNYVLAEAFLRKTTASEVRTDEEYKNAFVIIMITFMKARPVCIKHGKISFMTDCPTVVYILRKCSMCHSYMSFSLQI